MEMLPSISFVKAKPITGYKSQLMADNRESVEEMKLVRQGKLKARPIEDLLNEL